MKLQAALYEAVDAALSELGSTLKRSIVSVIEQNTISFRPDYTDIRKIDGVVRSMLGAGADVVMYMIYRKLCKNLEVKDYSPTINGTKPLEKILGLLELQAN